MHQYTHFALLLVGLAALSGCQPETPDNQLTGYIEVDYVYISASQPGRIEQLAFKQGDQVNAGDRMLVLESGAQSIGVAQAEAALAQAQANADNLLTGLRGEELKALEAQLNETQAALKLAVVQQERWASLVKIGATTQANKDQVDAETEVAAARVKTIESQIAAAKLPARPQQIMAANAVVNTAKETVNAAKWQLQQRQVFSPITGKVEQRMFREGEFIGAGVPVYAVLPNQGLKVKFFIAENKLSSVEMGQDVNVVLPGRNPTDSMVTAKVTYIAESAEFTPPIIYSNESREKLVFMVEATFSTEVALRPGQPIDVVLP